MSSSDDIWAQIDDTAAKPAPQPTQPAKKSEETTVPQVTVVSTSQPEPSPLPTSSPAPTPAPVSIAPPAPTVETPKPAAAPSVADDFFGDASPAANPVSSVPVVASQPPAISSAPAMVAPTQPMVDPSRPATNVKRDLSEASTGDGEDHMVYGQKGKGKTALALSMGADHCPECGAATGSPSGTKMKCPKCAKDIVVGERIAAISLDQQTRICHIELFGGDPRIKVYDGLRYFSQKNDDDYLRSAVDSLEYYDELLDGPIKEFNPHWIVVDGTERLNNFCEMKMKATAGLRPFAGAEWNLWKYRNMYLNNFHEHATKIARRGVIYTAYVDIQDVQTASGMKKREEPKWAGDIEQKVRVVIKVDSSAGRDGREFTAEVESSKTRRVPTSGGRIVVGSVDLKGQPTVFGYSRLESHPSEVKQ